MIYGIGIDIVEVKRIGFFLETERRMKKIFTDNEVMYIKNKNMNLQSAAGIWAAKEAFSKALGTGVVGFSMKDVEIISKENTRPYIKLYDKAYKLYESRDCKKIFLSISHEKEYAVANVIIEN